MAHPDPHYDLLLQDKYDELVSQYDQHSVREDPSFPSPSVALALALRGRTSEAEGLLEAVSHEPGEECGSIRLEAQMVIAIQEKRPLSEIESLASRAIEESGDAIFARRVLGDLSERRRQSHEALRHYEAAYEAAPGSERSFRDLARLLVVVGRFEEALDMIERMRPSLRREIYRLKVLLRGPAGVVGAVILGFLILATPTSVVAFWSAVVLGGALLALGLRWRDGLVFAAGVRLEILAIVAVVLRHLLSVVVSG